MSVLLVQVTSKEYVPGEPGAPWTLEETLIVKAKLYSIFNMWGGADALKQIYGTDKSPATFADVPDQAKMLRLAFHDCLRYNFQT